MLDVFLPSIIVIWLLGGGNHIDVSTNTATYPLNIFRPVLRRKRREGPESVIFFCWWHINVESQNHHKNQSSGHCKYIVCMLCKQNHHKTHMLCQKEEKSYGHFCDVPKKSEKCFQTKILYVRGCRVWCRQRIRVPLLTSSSEPVLDLKYLIKKLFY